MRILSAREWKSIPFADDDNARALREWLASNSTQQKAEFLGCHRRDGKIRSGNFIGAVWIGEGDCRAPLVVSPKFDNLDYLQMYLDCAKDKKIGARLGECFSIWPEQASIEADDAVFSELIVCAFLRELNDLCRRRLRRYFTAEEANLFGKVKGKIMLARQLRDNIPRARAANVWCRYNTASPDFLENRVLRAALEKSAKLLARSPMRESFVLPRRWIAAARVSLAGVSVEKIFVRDFACLRKSGVFAPYRRPLQLARMVLQTLGGDPRAEFETPKRVAPFALDSAELFERYAELRLREKYPDLQAGGKGENKRGDKAGFDVSIRPDFWLPKTDGSIRTKKSHLARIVSWRTPNTSAAAAESRSKPRSSTAKNRTRARKKSRAAMCIIARRGGVFAPPRAIFSKTGSNAKRLRIATAPTRSNSNSCIGGGVIALRKAEESETREKLPM